MGAIQKIGLEAVMEMANFNKGMKDYVDGTSKMEDKTSRLGSVLGKMGSGLETVAKVGVGAAIAGIGALTGVLYSSVKAAAEAQQVEAQLDQVLKSTGGAAGMTKEAILGLANSLSQVTPFEDEVIASAETMLLQFKNIGKDVFPQATEMALDLAQRLGIDASSAAKLLGKALEEPGEGLLRLKQAGVAFTDEQEEMIKKMVEAGDAAGAQKYIMDQLEQSVGGAARAAGDTFAGQLEIMKNQIGNVKESIGSAFLPILTQLAGKFNEFITKHGPDITAMFQKLADWLGENLPKAIEVASRFWTSVLYPALQAVWGFIQDPLIPILQTIFQWLGDHLPGALQTLANFWTNTLQPALQVVWQFITDSVVPALATVFEWIADNLPPVIQFMADLWNTVLYPALQVVWAFIVDYVVPALITIFDWVATNLPPVIEVLADLWENTLKPALEAVWAFIQDPLIPIFETVISFLAEAIPNAIDAVTEAFNWVKDNVLNPVAKAFEGIRDAVQWVIDKIKEVIDWFNTLAGSIPDWLVPGSPTPFELGLRGIADALRQVAREGMPEMTIGMRSLSGAGAGGVTNNSTTNNLNITAQYATAQRETDLRQDLDLWNRMMQTRAPA